MTVKLQSVDLDWLVNFVNEYAARPRWVAGEHHGPYPQLDTLGEYDLTLATGLSESQLAALADRIYRMFEASRADSVRIHSRLLS